MAKDRNSAYWLLNIAATGAFLVSPLSSLVLEVTCLADIHLGEKVPPGDLLGLGLFITVWGMGWALALISVVLGMISAIRFRSRWGAAVASSAALDAVILLFGIWPFIK